MSKLPTNAKLALMVAGIVVAAPRRVVHRDRSQAAGRSRVLKQQIDDTQRRSPRPRASEDAVRTAADPRRRPLQALARDARHRRHAGRDAPAQPCGAGDTGVTFRVDHAARPRARTAPTSRSTSTSPSRAASTTCPTSSTGCATSSASTTGVLNATGRLFSVDSITFNQGQATFPQVKASLTVSAYVFGDGTAPPVPAGAATARFHHRVHVCGRERAADPGGAPARA